MKQEKKKKTTGGEIMTEYFKQGKKRKEVLITDLRKKLKNLTYEELKKVSSFIVFNLENEK